MKPFDTVPANRHFGFRLDRSEPGRAVVAMDARTELSQETGVIHGGALAALADTAAVYALRPGLPEHASMTSIEFKLNFLAPALPGRGILLAEATVVRQGRRVGVCDVELRQEGRAVVRGLFTYLFTTLKRPPSRRKRASGRTRGARARG